MRTPQEIAIQCVRHAIKYGQSLEGFLHSWQSAVIPESEGDGSVYVNIAGGYLYPDIDSAESIRIKPYQIGVAIYRNQGDDAYGIFDARELWQAIVNPPPKQLSLFDEVMS